MPARLVDGLPDAVTAGELSRLPFPENQSGALFSELLSRYWLGRNNINHEVVGYCFGSIAVANIRLVDELSAI
jgi:hypothetical protein